MSPVSDAEYSGASEAAIAEAEAAMAKSKSVKDIGEVTAKVEAVNIK